MCTDVKVAGSHAFCAWRGAPAFDYGHVSRVVQPKWTCETSKFSSLLAMQMPPDCSCSSSRAVRTACMLHQCSGFQYAAPKTTGSASPCTGLPAVGNCTGCAAPLRAAMLQTMTSPQPAAGLALPSSTLMSNASAELLHAWEQFGSQARKGLQSVGISTEAHCFQAQDAADPRAD
jgi:hypothetical protein